MKIKQLAPLLLLPVIWGCYYVASQRVVSMLSVFTVGIVIRFITMILLSSKMLIQGKFKLLFQTKGVLPRLLLIGCLGFLLDITAFIGLSLSPAGSGTALLKLDIFMVYLISAIIYKEKFTKLDWTYLFIMISGVFLVMGIDLRTFELTNIGYIFFILSALFVSINAFVIKSVQHYKKVPVSNDVIAFYNNIVTMILFIAASTFMGTLGEFSLFAGNKPLILASLIAGLGQTLIYIVYYYNLKNNPVWLVKVFLLLMPIVAATLSYLLFQETMNRNQYIGIVIVLMGAFGILLEQKKKAIIINKKIA